MCPGVRLEGWLRWSAHPLGGVVCRGHVQYPVCSLQTWQLGFLVSYPLSRICPNCACTSLVLVPCRFFVFCCWRRGVSRCKHCSTAAKSPRSKPVSVLSVQLLLQVSAKIVGTVEHLSLEIQTQPTLPETPALGYLVGF